MFSEKWRLEWSKVVPTLSKVRKCSPNCRKCRCGRNALTFRRRGNSRIAWCRWTDEPCEPSNCSYAMCITRRLLPGGICGETVKRKTSERDIEEDLGPVIKVRGKTFRKLGEREIF